MFKVIAVFSSAVVHGRGCSVFVLLSFQGSVAFLQTVVCESHAVNAATNSIGAMWGQTVGSPSSSDSYCSTLHSSTLSKPHCPDSHIVQATAMKSYSSHASSHICVPRRCPGWHPCIVLRILRSLGGAVFRFCSEIPFGTSGIALVTS
jgi:hypothetical protein